MPWQHLLIVSAVRSEAVKGWMLNNAVSQVAPVEQVIVAVEICSPVSVSAIKMSNAPMFVWNRVIRANILQPLGCIDRTYLIISSNSNSRPRGKEGRNCRLGSCEMWNRTMK